MLHFGARGPWDPLTTTSKKVLLPPCCCVAFQGLPAAVPASDNARERSAERDAAFRRYGRSSLLVVGALAWLGTGLGTEKKQQRE